MKEFSFETSNKHLALLVSRSAVSNLHCKPCGPPDEILNTKAKQKRDIKYSNVSALNCDSKVILSFNLVEYFTTDNGLHPSILVPTFLFGTIGCNWALQITPNKIYES